MTVQSIMLWTSFSGLFACAQPSTNLPRGSVLGFGYTQDATWGMRHPKEKRSTALLSSTDPKRSFTSGGMMSVFPCVAVMWRRVSESKSLAWPKSPPLPQPLQIP